MKRAKIHPYDLEEFAAYICGLDYDKIEEDLTDTIEKALYDKFDIDLDQLQRLMEIIMPLIDVGESPLTNTKFKGFSNIEANPPVWLLKTEI